MTPPQNNPGPSPDIFFETVHAFHRTAALKAAIELDLFTAVDEGAETAEAIAKKCAAAHRGVRILCDYLVVIGWLKKREGRYALTPESATFASRRSKQYVGQALQFLLAPQQMEAFGNLTASVRNGGVPSASPEGGAVVPENPLWVNFARAMMPLMAFPAELLAQLLVPGLPPESQVLDIAAGHGLYGLAIARHSPASQVTALDWPDVLAVAQENARAANLESRFRLLPGNALSISYGNNLNLVLLTNFLHHFDHAICRNVLKKVYDALNPGGRAAILEFVPNEDRVTPSVPASFSLMMLATTPTGDAYTYSEYERLVKEVGFRGSELHPLNPTYFRVIIATK